jgi:REP-associated tyrosine transposase
MPRTSRIIPAGSVQHVMNRGNFRRPIFRDPDEYEQFLELLARAARRHPVRLLAYCLMPNHWHLVVWLEERVSLPAYMHWLTSTHVRHLHIRRGTVGLGHIYQERYRNVGVEDDRQLVAVCRYVEANPLRAGLVARAEEWPYSSLMRSMTRGGIRLTSIWPIPRPYDWGQLVNESAELADTPPNGASPGAPTTDTTNS